MREATARPTTDLTHADGPNAWRFTHASAARHLGSLIDGYTDYSERTASFDTRREVPSLRPVMIFNLGEPIAITGGDGARLPVDTGEAFIGGLHRHHALSASTGCQAGVHVWLTVAGYQRLLGAAAGELANRVASLSDVLGPAARVLACRLREASAPETRFALLDHALGHAMAARDKAAPELAWAFATLARHPQTRIGTIAQTIGWSRKRLIGRFQSQVGLAPKTVARVARFQRVTEACTPGARPDWAQIALEAGYFDQAHMIRDFTGFAGLSPARYHARLLPEGGGLPER